MFETFGVLAKALLDALSKLMDLQKMVQMTLISQNQVQELPGTRGGVVIEEKVTRKISASNFQDVLDELG